jgi:hypothetical protein
MEIDMPRLANVSWLRFSDRNSSPWRQSSWDLPLEHSSPGALLPPAGSPGDRLVTRAARQPADDSRTHSGLPPKNLPLLNWPPTLFQDEKF